MATLPLSPREFMALPDLDQKVNEIYGSILEGHDEFLWLHQDVKNVRDDLEEHVADQVAHATVKPGILPELTPRQKAGAGGGLAAAVITIIVYALEVLGG